MSDTRIRSEDPVVLGRCQYDGLIVKAWPLAESITLDLDGHAIVGSGHGSGILVKYGGSDGAVLIGAAAGRSGEVVGFETGVRALSSASLRRIERITAKANRREGFYLGTNGALLFDVAASRNGGDGLRLRGTGGRVFGLDASENGRSGLRLLGRGVVVEGRARGNHTRDVEVSGRKNDVAAVVVDNVPRVGALVNGPPLRSLAARSKP